MSDRFMTEVEIGGKIPRSIIPDLIGAIQAAGLDLDWNDGEPSEEALRQKLEECNGKETLSVNATELSGGNVDPLDQFCVANNIPFMKRVEGKYDYNGEIFWWQPGMPKILSWEDTDHEAKRIMVSLPMLKKARQAKKLLGTVIKRMELIAPAVPQVQLTDDAVEAKDPVDVGTGHFELL